MLLSILIPTLSERKESFNALVEELTAQIKFNKAEDKIQILYDATPRGEATIGWKREKLKRCAESEYLCYIDDDDMVSKHYIQLVLQAMFHKTNIITFGMDYYDKFNGMFHNTTMVNRFVGDSSRKYLKQAHYQRKVWSIGYSYHLMVVKKEIADRVEFIDANENEDYLYSQGLMKYIKNEVHIPHSLLVINPPQK